MAHEDIMPEQSFAVPTEGVTASGDDFQPTVHQWLLDCFGWEIAGDKLERGDRFLEESLELLQSGDYPRERVAALVDYVWGRPAGEPFQEVGGVMVTLAAYCVAHDLDMMRDGQTELDRIRQPAIVEKIRAKQAAKPTGSALPVGPVENSPIPALTVDALAQEIRRVDGNHSLGAGALAEALLPFIEAARQGPAGYGAERSEQESSVVSALQGEVERLTRRNVELNKLAYAWMVAHDMLKAGEHYDLPSVASAPPVGDVREKVARIIDWNAFKSFDSMVDYCLRTGDTEAEARDTAEWAHGRSVRAAFDKADAILALLSQPGEGES